MWRRLGPCLLLLAFAAGTRAQDDGLPPGAKLKVLDILFRVEDVGGAVADLQVKETGTEVRIELAADVLFEFDKAVLQAAAEDTLAKAAAIVREKTAGDVRIEGHTDSKGNDTYNQQLSERRAASVREWFVRHGFNSRRLTTTGFGETRPVAPNTRADGADDPDGRRKNRRVEIVIGKGG